MFDITLLLPCEIYSKIIGVCLYLGIVVKCLMVEPAYELLN